ncbi:hypothetical protein [Rhodococcoides kyotonense]|uniref:Uncharacterized protein n=1 Tax=Rhodococcoides kyotonense TaxID=398843 RepID=A0A239MTD3_9NOCA|nr:hypothetical protein [Rhodococcus kyotonensis]SNT46001.1 hypothetical protein SAMN05421642_12248 [Rhodococcus kyotonensis]
MTAQDMTAVAATRSESIRVRATEHCHLVGLQVDPRELRFAGSELAATILQLCQRATESAKAHRRTLLADDGVPADVLDRLGLPTEETVADSENRHMADEVEPTSWLRSV